MDRTQFISLIKRFLKGAIAGAVASIAMVTYQTPVVWADFNTILNTLAIAGVSGAIGGLILAVQKWASWTDAAI